jgi:hypothetical protein
MVSPVTKPVDNATNMANVTIWVPPGTWVEKDTGALVNGGVGGIVLSKLFDLSEVPVYIRVSLMISAARRCSFSAFVCARRHQLPMGPHHNIRHITTSATSPHPRRSFRAASEMIRSCAASENTWRV